MRPTAGLVQALPPCAAAKWPPTIAWISAMRGAEGVDVRLHEPRDELHEDEAADVSGRSVRPREEGRRMPWPRRRRARPSTRSSRMSSTRQASGKSRPQEDRRRPVLCAAAAVDDESAGLERRHADGRARPSFGKLAELLGVALQALRARDGRPDGERELGAGAETGMRRDHGADVDLVGRAR